jgi:hypothetical protein
MSSKEDKEFKINADFWFLSYFFVNLILETLLF